MLFIKIIYVKKNHKKLKFNWVLTESLNEAHIMHENKFRGDFFNADLLDENFTFLGFIFFSFKINNVPFFPNKIEKQIFVRILKYIHDSNKIRSIWRDLYLCWMKCMHLIFLDQNVFFTLLKSTFYYSIKINVFLLNPNQHFLTWSKLTFFLKSNMVHSIDYLFKLSQRWSLLPRFFPNTCI